MAQIRSCKYCGKEGFVWKKLGPDRWALFEADPQGRPVRNHTAECTSRPGASAQQSAQAAVSAVQQVIDSEADSISEFIDNAVATLDSEREAAADALTAPSIERYEVTIENAPTPEEIESFIPRRDDGHLIDAAQWAAIKRVFAAAAETGHPQNMGFHGPAGSGKSTLAVQCGAFFKRPTFVIDSTEKETANDWFGSQSIQDGTLTVHESEFVKAIETPNAVICLDDVALIQARTVQNGLNAVLDPSRRAIYVQMLGRTVRVAPGVVFIGTWNVGAEYTGASELSLQILDRFRAGALFEVPYPDDGTLATIIRDKSLCSTQDAARLADVAQWLRSDADPIESSTRGLIAAGRHLRHGATVGHALFYTVFGELDEGEIARAFGIIDTNLRTSGYPESERPRWAAPKSGNFVKLT